MSLSLSTEYKWSWKLATFSVKILITRSRVLKEFNYVVRTTRTPPASSSSSSSPWWSCSPWSSYCSSWSLSPSPAMTPRRSSSLTWRHKMTSQMTRYYPSIFSIICPKGCGMKMPFIVVQSPQSRPLLSLLFSLLRAEMNNPVGSGKVGCWLDRENLSRTILKC